MAEPHPLTPMLRKLEKWTRLGEADREAVLGLPHVLRTLDAHKYIIREGDRAENSCLLRSGFAYRHKIVGDGSRQILSIHMAGDIVDLQNSLLMTADHSVQALSTVEIALIPRGSIQALAAAHPAVGMAMWLDTLIDGSIFREWIANVGRRDARTRVAHLLCEFALRQEDAGLGERGRYELPMTQEQLADCTGLTSVHVNRTLKSLERDGLIRRNKRSVTIGDWQRLGDAGDFNPQYLHLEIAAEA
ncbi:Crp/Fnr family transcriptional regulator [Allosphingosinicella sp.]|uniref:Crp/Fnr family transcriptional regulator n=1 Tax=Allosphingosinicella sp. TaxID=2823234 RepID=UPI002F0E7FA0